MYRSIKAMTSNMLTAVSSPTREPTSWIDATDEFAEAANFWHAVSSVIDPRHVLDTFEHRPFRTPALEPEDMYQSLRGLKALLGSDDITTRCWFFLRNALADAANEANEEDDMDEVVHVLRDFFKRENDPTANIHPIIERHDWFYDDENSVDYGPEDADPTTEWTLCHDWGLPDDIPELPRKDRIILAWEHEWAQALVDADALRDKMKIPNLPDRTADSAIAVLKPIFATCRIHRRPGLYLAAHSLLEFVSIRSRIVKKEPKSSTSESSRAQAQPQTMQDQVDKQSVASIF